MRSFIRYILFFYFCAYSVALAYTKYPPVTGDLKKFADSIGSSVGSVCDSNGNRLGTGFVIFGNKVVTASHVGNSSALRFRRLGDPVERKLESSYSIKKSDLAVFQIQDSILLPYLGLGDISKMNIGDSLWYLASIDDSNFAIFSSTVTAKGKVDCDGELIEFVDFNTMAEHGFSGSPVMNLKGVVVGLLVQGWDAQDVLTKKTIKRVARAYSTNFVRVLEFHVWK